MAGDVPRTMPGGRGTATAHAAMAELMRALATRIAARLQDSVDLSAVHADLAATIEHALQPEHLSLWTGKA
jgi:hypothetical protein